MKTIGKHNSLYFKHENQIRMHMNNGNGTVLILADTNDGVTYTLSTGNGTTQLNNLAKKVYNECDFSAKFPEYTFIR